MATYQDFIPYVMDGVSQVSEPGAIRRIRDACIEFCKESRIWRVDLTPVDVVANQAIYAFVPPTDGNVDEVLEAYLDGVPLELKTVGDLMLIYPNRNWRDVNSTPEYVTQIDEDNLILVPYPTASSTGGLKLHVSVKPSRASATFPGTIFENWADKIAFGAIAMLMSTPGKPYTSPEGAMAYGSAFTEAKLDAKAQADRAHSKARRRVVGHHF